MFSECQRQQLALEEKLAKRRRRELQKLSQEQEKEEQFFLQNTEKSTDTKGLADVRVYYNDKLYL